MLINRGHSYLQGDRQAVYNFHHYNIEQDDNYCLKEG